jgi:copper(I)-binding protein
VSPSRWAASPIGRLVIAAAIVGLAGGVTACDAGNNAPTINFHPQSDGLDTVLHGIQIQDAFVLGAVNGSLPAGHNAGIFLALYNKGPHRDQLVAVSAPGVAKSVKIPSGGVGLPITQAVYLTGPKPEIVLTGLVRPLAAGTAVHVVLEFANAGSVTLDLPVLQRSDIYSTFSPAPAPSPTASRSSKASPSATSSASSSPSPSTTP